MNDNEDPAIIEVLYGLAMDAEEQELFVTPTRRRNGVEVTHPHPPPGQVTVRHADGTSEIRDMNRKELDAWNKAEGVEE